MTVQVTRANAEAFSAAVAAHIEALMEWRTSVGAPRPAAVAEVEAAVKRVQGPLLTGAAARAVLSKNVCAHFVGHYEAMIAGARSTLMAQRRAMTMVQKFKTKIYDPHAEAERAIGQIEGMLTGMRAGKLPQQYEHFVPQGVMVNEGPDTYVADYEVVD